MLHELVVQHLSVGKQIWKLGWKKQIFMCFWEGLTLSILNSLAKKKKKKKSSVLFYPNVFLKQNKKTKEPTKKNKQKPKPTKKPKPNKKPHLSLNCV